jgi:hypothetical protein
MDGWICEVWTAASRRPCVTQKLEFSTSVRMNFAYFLCLFILENIIDVFLHVYIKIRYIDTHTHSLHYIPYLDYRAEILQDLLSLISLLA